MEYIEVVNIIQTGPGNMPIGNEDGIAFSVPGI